MAEADRGYKKYASKALSLAADFLISGYVQAASEAIGPLPQGGVEVPKHTGAVSKGKDSKLKLPPFSTGHTLFSEKHTDQTNITAVRILAESVTAAEILGEKIDEKRDRAQLKGMKLSVAPMRWAVIDRQDGTAEYLGVTMNLVDGKTLNQLLFSNATDPMFGLDAGDIWKDWADIEGKSADMVERKGRHEGMGEPWEVFGRDKALFGFLVGRDQLKRKDLAKDNPKPMILPVMRWVNGPNGRSFIYDLPDSGIYKELIADFMTDKPDFLPHLPEPQCFNPTVAVLEIGHFSADVRANWRKLYGYGQEEERRGNGSTQAGVQTLRFDSPSPVWYRPEDGLLGGKFVRKTEELVAARAQLR